MLRLKNKNQIYPPLAACLILFALFYQAKAQHQHQTPEYSPAFNVASLPAPPIAPAVANAIYAATGKRIRRLPFDLT